MTKKFVLGAILGGIVIFVWGAISWMVLPWHTWTLKTFTNEDAVAEVLSENAPGRGIYIYPGHQHKPDMTEEDEKAAEEAAWEKMRQGPLAFVSFDNRGIDSIVPTMVGSFLINVLSALLVTMLLLKTQGLVYWNRVSFVVLIALTAGVICHLPNWIWWGFSTRYTLLLLVDMFIGWFLAGLVIAKIADSQPTT